MFFAISGGGSPADAARHALVVGINDYPRLKTPENPGFGQLRKAINDARSVAGKLSEIGYIVTRVENVDQKQFNEAWGTFVSRVAPGDEVAFFYSGHGVEIGGQNFLVPADAERPQTANQTLFKKQLIDLGELTEWLQVDGRPRVALYIIDACRENPFVDGKSRSVGGARGLAMVDPAQGSFMMFSAGPRELALDRLSDSDPDPNSVYTRKLLPLLGQKGLTIQDVAIRIREEVASLAKSALNHDQNPAYRDDLVAGRGPLCVAGCDKPANEAGSSEPAESEAVAAVEPSELKAGNTGNTGDASLAGELRYLKCTRENDLACYEGFLAEFPGHPRQQDALTVIRMASEIGLYDLCLKSEGELVSCERYLAEYRDGKYVAEVNDKIAALKASIKPSDPPAEVVPEKSMTVDPSDGEQAALGFGRVCRLNPAGDNFLSLRDCAGRSCTELRRLGPDTELTIIEREGGWLRVRTLSGRTGWVSSRYVCISAG